MADYTPTLGDFTELKPFRFWCQKVLPLVYDDSLSYYELLCKVVDYLNKTMEDVDTMHDDVVNLHSAYVQLQTYVNTYFDNLDVQVEIDNKLDAMAQDGTLTNIISPFIPDLVSDWLDDHITPTTPVVDNTLSISGAAADSKAVGDKFKDTNNLISNNMYNLLEGLYTPTIGTVELGGIDASTGELQTNVARARTRLIPLHKSDRVGFTGLSGLWFMLIRYDYNGNYIDNSTWYNSQVTIQNTDYYRILFSISNVDDLTSYLDDIESAMYITYLSTEVLANAISITPSNYNYYLTDANTADRNKSYIILLDSTQSRPAHLPTINNKLILLSTHSQADTYSGSIQTVLSDDCVYRRIYSDNQWTAWEEVTFKVEEYYTLMQTYIYTVSYANYASTLPDLNAAPINKRFRIVRIGNEASNTFPANIPVSWDTLSDGVITSIVETYAENDNYMGGIQTLKNEYGYWIRHYSGGQWQNWVRITESNTAGRNKIVVDGVNTSFSQGIITAYQLGNCDVYVNKATYDIKAEFEALYGSNVWSTGYTSCDYYRGLPFGNGMHIIGSPGAKVVMDASEILNTDVWAEFSVLMNYTGAQSDQKINIVENITFDCTCIRYCIHLDQGAVEIDDEYIIRSCRLYLDNEDNTTKTFAYCVGMGASINTTYVIEDCYVYAVAPANPRDTAYIYYHNTNATSPNNELIVKNNYIDNGGTVRVDEYGESENNCLVLINNNSLGSQIHYQGVTANVKVLEWNNEVRV